MDAETVANCEEQPMRGNTLNKGVTGLRHVQMHHHCVQESHGQEVIAMIFTKSSEKEVCVMTKNATRQEFERHSPELVDKVPEELLAKAKEKEGCQNACLVGATEKH